MSDDTKKSEHPAPWRWHAPGFAPKSLAATALLDADGMKLLDSDEDFGIASPLARELIRLAPELERSLRDVIDRIGGIRPAHPVVAKAILVLAALDAARSVKP